MNILNDNGPKMKPWGMPESISDLEIQTLILNLCLLLDKYEFINFNEGMSTQ